MMRYIHHYTLKIQPHGCRDSLKLASLVLDFFRAKPNVVKHHCFLDEKIVDQHALKD
jgi:hypothetical protein